MPQGKIKVKAQLPGSAKGKKVKKLDKAKPAKQRLAPQTIGPKKQRAIETKKMKKVISKTINKTLEDRLVAQVAQQGKPMAVLGRKESKGETSQKK